jgi:Family of unknown function (DUF6173)
MGIRSEFQLPDMAELHATNHGFARVIFRRLKERIESFQARLAPNQEIGAYLASFGPQTLISIDRMGYSDPFLIIFSGVDQTGNRVELVQHTTQLSLLFTTVTLAEESHGRRIGFQAD